jgi:hypothetical protein
VIEPSIRVMMTDFYCMREKFSDGDVDTGTNGALK